MTDEDRKREAYANEVAELTQQVAPFVDKLASSLGYKMPADADPNAPVEISAGRLLSLIAVIVHADRKPPRLSTPEEYLDRVRGLLGDHRDAVGAKLSDGPHDELVSLLRSQLHAHCVTAMACGSANADAWLQAQERKEQAELAKAGSAELQMHVDAAVSTWARSLLARYFGVHGLELPGDNSKMSLPVAALIDLVSVAGACAVAQGTEPLPAAPIVKVN